MQLIWSKVLAFKKVTNSVTLPVFNQILANIVSSLNAPSPQFRDHTETWANIAEEQKWDVKSNNQQKENSSDLIFLRRKYPKNKFTGNIRDISRGWI